MVVPSLLSLQTWDPAHSSASAFLVPFSLGPGTSHGAVATLAACALFLAAIVAISRWNLRL